MRGCGRMSTKAATEDVDVKILLSAVYQRLNQLAQDMGLIRMAILKEGTTGPSPGAFSAFGGAWRGIEISEQDIQEARFSVPGDL
jgi:hypothetical protein